MVQRRENGEKDEEESLFELLPLAAATTDEEARCHGGDGSRAGERRLGARPAEVVALGSPPRGCSLGYSYNAKSVKNAYFVCYQNKIILSLTLLLPNH